MPSLSGAERGEALSKRLRSVFAFRVCFQLSFAGGDQEVGLKVMRVRAEVHKRSRSE